MLTNTVGLEAVLGSAAMVHFLQRVLDSGEHAYDAAISEELDELAHIHFTAVYNIRHLTMKPVVPKGVQAVKAAALP